MNKILVNKAIKRGIIGSLMLCWLLSLSSTLQAVASATQSDTQESYDYTLQNHSDQVSPIEREAYLDIEDIPQELTIILQVVSKDHQDIPQLLAMTAEDVQNRQYYKYLFASNGLLVGNEPQQKAHDLNYHLVKAPAGPVIWQALAFLDQKPYLVVKELLLPYSAQLCLPCGHMARQLFDKKLPMHKAGCQGQPFPTTAAPASAIACFYSDRFTDQQQRLVISQIGDTAFPDPKKRITPPATHGNDHHKLTSKPLTDALPADQLLIPANGQCLYTTIIMGYLLPVRQKADKLNARIDQLFGMQLAYYLNELYQTLQNPTHYLPYLHSHAFSTLVTAFMARMQIEKGTWGGPAEIQTIATKLKVNIQTYYPDPNNPTKLVEADLTKPAKAIAAIMLHIVRDKVHPAEVLTQTERASAKNNPHYQHYRLKYTLPPSIVPVLPSKQPLISHKIGLQQKSQPYSVEWFKATETGNRKLLSVNLRNLNLQGTNFSQVTLPKDLSGTNLTNAKLPKDLSKHSFTHANLSNTNLTNVKLPKDLSATNLTHANLTGQRFTATNFEGAQLEGVILTNTVCDYQQCFKDHIKANNRSGGSWYHDNLPKDLKSIAQIYPRLSQNTHKAELLQIASGLAYLPYYEGKEFYIKVAYWSCKLLMLKKQLSNGLEKQLVCSLGNYPYGLNHDAENYCWQTDYPQNQVEEAKEAPHNDFDQYLKTFQAGLQQYNCKSKYKSCYNWYKNNIEKNIQGLQKTYPKLTAPKLQKAAVDIAFQLSKSYQNQHWHFLFRYLFLQNQLIRLKILAGLEVGNEIYYNRMALLVI